MVPRKMSPAIPQSWKNVHRVLGPGGSSLAVLLERPGQAFCYPPSHLQLMVSCIQRTGLP